MTTDTTLIQALQNNTWKDKPMPNTQHKNILKHLKKAGGITVREAMIEYSISSLTKRVHELRAMGFSIVSNKKHHPVTGQRYVRYTLEQET